MNSWGMEISRAIKEGKWLAIQYENTQNETTKFWCAINDINPINQKMTVDVFNIEKSNKVLKDCFIFFNMIISATVLDNTFYQKPEKLIEKLNTEFENFLFLEGKPLDDRILNYYLECFGLDNEPFQTEFALIPGIDNEILSKPTEPMEQELFDRFLSLIKKQLKIKTSETKMIFEKIVINQLSICSTEKGILPIAYYNIFIDIENRRLIPDNKLEFNAYTVQLKKGTQLYLSQYIEFDFNYFKEHYLEKEEEFKEMIRSHLNRFEKLDEMPYFLKMSGIYGINLKDEYSKISESITNESMSTPLKSFFGIDLKERPKKRNVIVNDRKINKNQLRVVYNAINRNILFVQGPPGTGKTTSILNIIHSCLFNGDSCLLASGNNEAVDHVLRKLRQIRYKQVPIYYPVLRLGRDDIIESSLSNVVNQIMYLV